MSLDLYRARIVLRDRSVSDVLDLSLRFMVVEGRAYARVAATLLLPMTLLTLAVGVTLSWPVAAGVGLAFATTAEVFFTVLASRLVFAESVVPRDVVGTAAAGLPRVLLARLLAFAAIAAGLALFVVVGVWAAATCLFVSEIILLERAPLSSAFARSGRVAMSALSDVVLGAVTLAAIPIGAVLLADIAGRAFLGGILELGPLAPVWTARGGALATLGLFAQVPFAATARFFLYLNVRTRAEGWDIQTRFNAIVSNPARESARAPEEERLS
jgi:hypothetical protein